MSIKKTVIQFSDKERMEKLLKILQKKINRHSEDVQIRLKIKKNTISVFEDQEEQKENTDE